MKKVKDYIKAEKVDGCYSTPDGNIFERSLRGLNYAHAHQRPVSEWSKNGELISDNVAKDSVELKNEILEKTSHRVEDLHGLSCEQLSEILTPSTEDPDLGDQIDLDKMNKAQLLSLLVQLDPTAKPGKSTKDQIMDLIEDANTLDAYDKPQLIELLTALDKPGDTGEPAVLEGLSPDQVESLSEGNLRALALLVRDQVHDTETQAALDAIGMIVDTPEDTTDQKDVPANDNTDATPPPTAEGAQENAQEGAQEGAPEL